jgi:sulfate/thiosulfate transport system permease protein
MVEAKRRKPDTQGLVVFGGIVAYMSVLLLIPLGALVWTVASDFREVVKELLSPESLHAMALTLAVAFVCVVLNGVFGISGAIVLVRQRFFGRRFLDSLVDLPLALSPVMTGLAFLILFGRSGALRPVIDLFGFQVAFAAPGVLLATLFVTLPFTLREVALVLEEVGDSEEQAAATLGASSWQTFRRVTFPNIYTGLTIGTTLTLARALGEFGAVLVVGGGIANKTETATTFIHTAVEERHEPAAFGMALLLAAAAIGLLLVLQNRKGRLV